MKRLLTFIGGAFASGNCLFVHTCFQRECPRNAKTATVTSAKDVAPIFYQELRELSSTGRTRADVAALIQGSPTLGKSIKEKVVYPADASLARGPAVRSLRKRSAAYPAGDRHDSGLGRWRCKGRQRQGPAAAAKFRRRVETRQARRHLLDERGVHDRRSGSDEYINFTMPTNFQGGRRGSRRRRSTPATSRVVHHVVAFIQTPQMIAQGGQLSPEPAVDLLSGRDAGSGKAGCAGLR